MSTPDFTSTPSQRLTQTLLLSLDSLGMLLNILLLIAGIRSPQVRRVPFNYLLMCQLVSDLFVQIVSSISTTQSLYTGTTPAARPLFCQAQATTTMIAASVGFCCMGVTALSRYCVIVTHIQLSRHHYLYMIAGCVLGSLLNCMVMVVHPELVDNSNSGLLCLVVRQ